MPSCSLSMIAPAGTSPAVATCSDADQWACPRGGFTGRLPHEVVTEVLGRAGGQDRLKGAGTQVAAVPDRAHYLLILRRTVKFLLVVLDARWLRCLRAT